MPMSVGRPSYQTLTNLSEYTSQTIQTYVCVCMCATYFQLYYLPPSILECAYFIPT